MHHCHGQPLSHTGLCGRSVMRKKKSSGPVETIDGTGGIEITWWALIWPGLQRASH